MDWNTYIGMYIGNIDIFIFIYMLSFFLIKRSIICNKPYIHTHHRSYIYFKYNTFDRE